MLGADAGVVVNTLSVITLPEDLRLRDSDGALPRFIDSSSLRYRPGLS